MEFDRETRSGHVSAVSQLPGQRRSAYSTSMAAAPAEPARRVLDRLRALAADPARQADYAAEALLRTADAEVANAAANILAEYPRPSARPEIIGRIQELRAARRRDPGGALRAALIRALEPIARHDDTELLAEIIATAEGSLQGPADGPRAAALLALHRLDPVRAAYHAVDLLWEYAKRASAGKMGSEPAASAIRVLAASGQTLAVYSALASGMEVPTDVVGECIRALEGAPPLVAERLFAQFTGGRDEFLLLGAVDLAIAHPGSPALHALLAEFLETAPPDVFRYAVSAIVASRRTDLLGLILTAAEAETKPRRLTVYRDALALARGDERVPSVLASVRSRLAELRTEG